MTSHKIQTPDTMLRVNKMTFAQRSKSITHTHPVKHEEDLGLRYKRTEPFLINSPKTKQLKSLIQEAIKTKAQSPNNFGLKGSSLLNTPLKPISPKLQNRKLVLEESQLMEFQNHFLPMIAPSRKNEFSGLAFH